MSSRASDSVYATCSTTAVGKNATSVTVASGRPGRACTALGAPTSTDRWITSIAAAPARRANSGATTCHGAPVITMTPRTSTGKSG